MQASRNVLLSIVEKGFRKELAQIIIPHRPASMDNLREIAASAEKKTLAITSKSAHDISGTINQAVQSAITSSEMNLLNTVISRMNSTLSAITRPEQHRMIFSSTHSPSATRTTANPNNDISLCTCSFLSQTR